MIEEEGNIYLTPGEARAEVLISSVRQQIDDLRKFIKHCDHVAYRDSTGKLITQGEEYSALRNAVWSLGNTVGGNKF